MVSIYIMVISLVCKGNYIEDIEAGDSSGGGLSVAGANGGSGGVGGECTLASGGAGGAGGLGGSAGNAGAGGYGASAHGIYLYETTTDFPLTNNIITTTYRQHCFPWRRWRNWWYRRSWR